jgi:hypothetical protein
MPTNGGMDGYLIRLGSDGTVQWEKHFGGAADDVLRDLDVTADGNIIAVGYTHSYGAGDRNGYLLKTNLDGDLSWEKPVDPSESESIQYGGTAPDGGFVLAGSSGYDAILIKTDASGDKEWEKRFRPPQFPSNPPSRAYAQGLVPDFSGAIAMLWQGDYYAYEPVGRPCMDVTLHMTSPSGESLFNGSRGVDPNTECLSGCLARGRASNMLFSFRCYAFLQELVSVAEDGSTLFAVSLESAGLTFYNEITVLTQLSSGMIVAVVDKGSLYALDASGDYLGSALYDGVTFTDLAESNDNHILAAGYTRSSELGDQAVVAKIRRDFYLIP